MTEAEMSRKILSAPEKIILQRNVEFVEFVETEDKLRSFRCGHCHQVAIIHVQLKCGHVLCQECFPIFHLKRCPATDCNEDVENTVFDTKCFDDEISNFRVLCKYHKGGCDVIVSLSNLLSHERNCPFSKHTNENGEELTKCKEEIRFLKRQFAEFQVQLQPLMTLIKDKSLGQTTEIEDIILEKVKMESVKERMKLERKLKENFENYIDNKMEILESKTETKLLSKCKNDFQNPQDKILKEIKENTDMIEKSVRHETSKKLIDEVENLKKELQKDFLTQNEELKKMLQEKSKTFIEGVGEVKCLEIEKKDVSNLIDECKKYSEEIKKELSHDFEFKLKEYQENERAFTVNEIKREVNFKGNEIKSNAIQQFNKDLRKHLQNEKYNLEKRIYEKYEYEKRQIKNELKTVLSSEIRCDITSLSKRLDVISEKSLHFIWEIPDFKDKIANDQFDNSKFHTWISYLKYLVRPPQLSIESEVFDLYEIGCKFKFIFHLHPKVYFEVKYVDRPSDKVFPFNGHHRITFILTDQVDNQSHNDFIRIFEPTFGDWTNCTLFGYWLSKDQLSFLHSRWPRNGTIQVKVQMEPFDCIMALEPRHFGHIFWKIDHFKDIRESYQHGRQCSISESLYSSEKGYRMKGLLFVGDKVYFRLCFLKGPWDKYLPKTFKHRTTISLISQKDQSELEDMTISKESDSTKLDAIDDDFTAADLEKYVKDDSLIISLKVEAL